jgi:hypothetical protein
MTINCSVLTGVLRFYSSSMSLIYVDVGVLLKRRTCRAVSNCSMSKCPAQYMLCAMIVGMIVGMIVDMIDLWIILCMPSLSGPSVFNSDSDAATEKESKAYPSGALFKSWPFVTIS